MRHEALGSHFENDFTVRNWVQSFLLRHPDKKYLDLASTRFGIHMGFKNIHSGERIQKFPDSPENSPDTCGQKANPERKCCGFKKSGYVWKGSKINMVKMNVSQSYV